MKITNKKVKLSLVGLDGNICVLFGFSGCGGASNDLYPDSAYKIFKIEECEYILISRRPFAAEFSLTHKGNCTNQIHIYAKQ